MQQLKNRFPGLVIAGLRGGSGKTVISLGITAAWKESGLSVSPFKKGPDYIDAGWLASAAGRPCYNLDTYLCTPSSVISTFHQHTTNSDIAVVEGNRGLFDGIDTDGTTSTAEIAKLLSLPVLLVLDCTKCTRTMAALLMGCMQFDPEVNIMGVILNQVAGPRHEGKVRDNIEKFCNVKVFGAVPKLKAEDFPERHMGLVPSVEHRLANQSIRSAAAMAETYIDLDDLYNACKENAHSPAEQNETRSSLDDFNLDSKGSNLSSQSNTANPDTNTKPVIGVIRDSAFQFYYPDNLEALEISGATLKFISPLRESLLPAVDAIYMGGGFPETHASELAQNKTFRNHLKDLALSGLPIYAECGGLIFLGDAIVLNGKSYPMAGVFPITFGLSERPVGHGYTLASVVNPNPFYAVGTKIKGHEFRYSSISSIDYEPHEMAFSMKRGRGIVKKLDGFTRHNVFGTYTHIMALGTPSWADSLVRLALQFKKRK